MKKTIKNEKTFDAVKMMREIRIKISNETQNMTFKELKDYIKIKLSESKAKLIEQE
jgi:hypothetical protein